MDETPKAQGSSACDGKSLSPAEADKAGAEARLQLLAVRMKAGCFLSVLIPRALSPKSDWNQERFPGLLSDLPNTE